MENNKIKNGVLSSYKFFTLTCIISQVIAIVLLKKSLLMCGSLFCISATSLYIAIVALIAVRIVFWNIALSKAPLSKIYVFTSLTPALLILVSAIFLSEKISSLSMLGGLLITAGIFLNQRKQL